MKEYRDGENLHFNNMFVKNVKYLIRYMQDKQHNLKNDWQEVKSPNTILSRYDYIDYVTNYTGDLNNLEIEKQRIHNLTDEKYITKDISNYGQKNKYY